MGKSEANLLLSDIGQVLGKALPANVLVCRCPHYEFALLLTKESSLNAVKITERLKAELQSIASTTIPPQLELKCGVGLANVDDLTQSADVLLARARHNLSQYYYLQDFDNPNPFLVSIDSETVLKGIQTGLREDSFRLSFQPIVSLKDDEREHYEVRCAAPESFAAIPTSAMFEYAVLNAFGEPIDRWVIRQVFRLFQFGRKANLQLTINLSQNSLVSADFFPWLQAELKEYPGIREHVIFQVSELDILISQHHMTFFCQQLADLQLTLSVSHFGCTADPFRYLPLISAHRVKLDVSLLERINESANRRKLLAETVAKLHEHGLRVTAAMVEQMLLLPLLWRANVNFVQGNCFQAPTDYMNFQFNQRFSLSVH
ncbi:MAG: EAL domain-containing protein [Pseudomonadales bacterium]|nr:EAL domain-containing protein [Pseudomonadales bacterium]